MGYNDRVTYHVKTGLSGPYFGEKVRSKQYLRPYHVNIFFLKNLPRPLLFICYYFSSWKPDLPSFIQTTAMYDILYHVLVLVR